MPNFLTSGVPDVSAIALNEMAKGKIINLYIKLLGVSRNFT